jgi:branched-chain amino acid transport system ATP-binding protein
MSTLLEISGLHLGYGRTSAVKGIDLSVPAGGVVCLIGANGAGKTTTMRGLSGLLKPSAGTIRFDGTDITGTAAHRIAKLGIRQVPEGRQVFAEMTVDENLHLGGLQAPGAEEFGRRRDQVLQRFPRLRERLTQQAGLLSGGEQQMLALGRALMGNPRVLLLDEPSEGLAPLIVAEVGRTIALLKSEGQSIVLVEQNSNLALDLADQVVILTTGQCVFDGGIDEIRANEAVLTQNLGVFQGH